MAVRLLLRITETGLSILAIIIRDPLRLSVFVSAPSGALSSLLAHSIVLAINVQDCRMAWPSSRPRDSSPRIICGEPSFLKATMTKSISILSFLSNSAKRKHFSGTRNPRSCARAFRVCARACFACRPWSKGFPCDDVRGPRGLSGIMTLFAMITSQFAFILHRGPGGPMESCAAFPMFVALFHHY